MPVPDGREYAQRIIEDTAKGVRVAVDDATESITTSPLSPAKVEALKHPAAGCVTNQPRPAESTIMGYKAVREVVVVPSPEKRRLETWLAPDLGCALLRQTMFTENADGSETKLASKEVVSVAVGDPAATLFQIPDWKERSPSEVMTEFSRRFHVNAMLTPSR